MTGDPYTSVLRALGAAREAAVTAALIAASISCGCSTLCVEDADARIAAWLVATALITAAGMGPAGRARAAAALRRRS